MRLLAALRRSICLIDRETGDIRMMATSVYIAKPLTEIESIDRQYIVCAQQQDAIRHGACIKRAKRRPN